MKYALLAALLILSACTWVVDTRTDAQRAATATARAAQPISGNVGVLRIHIKWPVPTIEPKVLP